MVNVFRLRSIINLLNGQVAGDLETCSGLWRIMSPRAEWQGTWKLVHSCGESCRHLAFGSGDMIRHSREQVSKSPAT